MDEPDSSNGGSSNRRTISATCRTHGARNFCNLRLTKEDGNIVVDPHVAGGCVIELDETAATAVHETLGEWLG